MSDFLAFMRGRLLETLLVAVSAAALFSTIVYGFHVEDYLRHQYAAIVLLPLLLSFALTAASYSPRTVVFGGVAITLVCVCMVVVGGASSGHPFFYDEYGNVGFFLLLGIVPTTCGHVMTRRRVSSAVYAAGGCITCGLIQFLYHNDLLIQLVVFMLFAIALCTVCTGRRTERSIATQSRTQASYLVVGFGTSLIAFLLACVVFALVVFPLNPPVMELKPFTDYYSLETLHVKGEQQIEHKENDKIISDNGVQGDEKTNKENNEVKDVTGDKSNDAPVGDNGDDLFGSRGFNLTGFGDPTTASRYLDDAMSRLPLVIAVIVVVVAIIFGAKMLLRRRRYRHMNALPPNERIAAFYRFFDERFSRLGVARNNAATPLEHAMSSSDTMSAFEQNADGATFLQLARSYCACAYGLAQPDSADAEACNKLYGVFYGNARRFVGTPRYLRCFFFI